MSYMYVREATKVPWIVKGQKSHIDQLKSSTPDLITQLKGIPTTKRYKYVTVFVDNYTRFT
jgi:hypothetical protein